MRLASTVTATAATRNFERDNSTTVFLSLRVS